MKKEIKVEWCEEFIKAAFGKHHPFADNNPGIEINCLESKIGKLEDNSIQLATACSLLAMCAEQEVMKK